ncbi:MAG: thiamine pyrophosphate-binding protein [Salinigranum sp.]
MNGAEAIVEVLSAGGVRRCFGVSGESVLTLLDAIRTREVAYTPVRHEGGGALAASGYARHHRRPVACLGHIGAGASNLVNGIADAYKDCVPVVALTGNAETRDLGRDVWHEIDHLGIFESITEYSVRIDHPERVPQAMREAVTALNTGTPGPILVDVPADVADATLDSETVEAVREVVESVPAFGGEHARVTPESSQIEAAVEGFLAAENPVVLAGGGAFWSDAGAAIQSLTERTGVPVITTLTGRGVVPETHDNCFGALGIFGRETARTVAEDADFLLAVGTDLGENETFDWELFGETDIVHVNTDEIALGRHYTVQQAVLADARAFLESFLGILGDRSPDVDEARVEGYRRSFAAELETIRSPTDEERADTESGLVSPYEIMTSLAAVKGPDDVVCAGAGQHSLWANILPAEAPGTALKSVGLGSMGFAYSAGIGATVEDDATAFVIVGDGDLAMVCQELWTAAQEDLPVVAVVFNDRQLSAIKNPQSIRFDGPPFGVDYDDADLATVAEGFGVLGVRVESGDEFEPALREALDADGPALLDVTIDPSVKAPSFFYEYQ